jgi:hypothetical protein
MLLFTQADTAPHLKPVGNVEAVLLQGGHFLQVGFVQSNNVVLLNLAQPQARLCRHKYWVTPSSLKGSSAMEAPQLCAVGGGGSPGTAGLHCRAALADLCSLVK